MQLEWFVTLFGGYLEFFAFKQLWLSLIILMEEGDESWNSVFCHLRWWNIISSFQPSSCSTLNKSQVSLIILASLLTIAFILLFVGFFIRHRIAIWLRGGSKSNTPLYDRSLLVGSNGYDKSDQLSDTTFYSTTRRNSDRSSPPKISMRDEDEDGYYSSMLLPYDYPPQLYSTPRRFHSLAPEYCPIPPAATTIPSPPVLTDESLSNDSCNFRIISEYPVPITELWRSLY